MSHSILTQRAKSPICTHKIPKRKSVFRRFVFTEQATVPTKAKTSAPVVPAVFCEGVRAIVTEASPLCAMGASVETERVSPPNRSKRFGTNFTPARPLNSQDRQIAGAKGSCWTLAHLAALLKRDYAVTYRDLLAKCSFSYQRPAKQYKSHSEAKLREFEETLEKIVDLAQNAPKTVILAEDEASLYLQASLRRVWAPTGQTPVIRGGGRAKQSRCAPI